jgi:outer membrane protein TolC
MMDWMGMLRTKVKLWLPVGMACLAFAGLAGEARGQTADALPSAPVPQVSAVKFAGGAEVQQATAGPLPLSLDDAIARGVKSNLTMELSRQNERAVKGQVLTVGNYLLPDMTASGRISAQEINLAALGFKPSSLEAFGFPPGTIKEIVKVNTAEAQIAISQQLFNVPAYYLLRAAQQAGKAAELTTLLQRGNVTLQVGNQYLLALADQAQIANAQALEKADEEELRQAVASHDAGVGTNLDVLRARVQLQTQQQTLINAENTFAKDKIALTRLIGLPADQELTLTDTSPYAQFEEMPLEQAMALAYVRRKDLLSLQAQGEVAERTERAIRYEHYPSLSFGGYYGVLGQISGLYHGVFTAQGNLDIPIFKESQFRGEHEVAVAQMTGVKQQIASLKQTIESQIRSSMLDVQSSADLVKVARSNVDLATEELQQSSDRFAAGVDDNLAVVQAQAVLASAQTKLVGTLYQYNSAKLQLARNTGVVETQYKVYLGR